MIDVAGGARYYYHYDGLGSVVALSDSTGAVIEKYRYNVFGSLTIYDENGSAISTSSVANPYYFTARRFDTETGNYYYRARMYHPRLGRFLQPDPIGYGDGLNIYTYCHNNPVNWIDPYGLFIKGLLGTVASTTGGGLLYIAATATAPAWALPVGAALVIGGTGVVVWDFFDEDDVVDELIDKVKEAFEKYKKDVDKEIEDSPLGGSNKECPKKEE